MTRDEFRRSLADPAPPPGLSPPSEAPWRGARGCDWFVVNDVSESAP